MRIGIWGGTFDPVHEAHVKMAAASAAKLALDTMYMLPAGAPPHRTTVAPSAHRSAMLRLALDKYPELQQDDRELRRTGDSYSIITCREFRQEHPEAELFLCMGADAYALFHEWLHWREILKLVNVVVVARPGAYMSSFNQQLPAPLPFDSAFIGKSGSVLSLELELIEASSTAIRAALSEQNKPVPHLDQRIENYIYEHKLYQ